MGSSRLPGKILLDIAGKPMLAWVVERTRKSSLVDETVVATTTETADQEVVQFCKNSGIPVYQGSTYDVLDRYYQTARRFQAEVVVRITADCPLMDPELINDTLHAFYGLPVREGEYVEVSQGGDSPAQDPRFPFDFAADRLPPPWRRSFPIGLDIEVCTFQALEQAWREATRPHQREHVMPFLYEFPGRFCFVQLHHAPDYGQMRWTVDTPEDLALVRQIFSLIPDRDNFSWLDIVDLFHSNPELAQINDQVSHKTYRDVDHRLPESR